MLYRLPRASLHDLVESLGLDLVLGLVAEDSGLGLRGLGV